MTDDTGQLTPEQSAESQQRSILGMHEGLRRLTVERAALKARVEELERESAHNCDVAYNWQRTARASLEEAVGLLRRYHTYHVRWIGQEAMVEKNSLSSLADAFLAKHPAPAKGASDES